MKRTLNFLNNQNYANSEKQIKVKTSNLNYSKNATIVILFFFLSISFISDNLTFFEKIIFLLGFIFYGYEIYKKNKKFYIFVKNPKRKSNYLKKGKNSIYEIIKK